MTLADAREIVARSSTVHERMCSGFTPSDAADDPCDLVGRRVERWKERACAGNDERFARYLQWLGLDAASSRRAVTPSSYDGVLPSWAKLLLEVNGEPWQPADTTADPTSVDVPFAEVLAPFIHVARRRLHALAGSAAASASTSICGALEASLARQLVKVAGQTLYAEFNAFRAADAALQLGPRNATVAPFAMNGRATYQLHDRFTRHLRDDRCTRLLLTYPVLARLLATRVVDWIDATAEFLLRLERDRPLLEATFGAGAPLGAVNAVVTDLSDRHRGGRTASRVTFASGVDLVYKPRSGALEHAFRSLIEWLNTRETTVPLYAPRVVDCRTHSWSEFVEHLPCRAPADVERYYHRAGMLACLAYVFGGADLHEQNVVAHGEFPVLVDLEVFMSAPVRPHDGGEEPHDGDGQIFDSLLRTGLLPLTRQGLRGQSHRTGGLAQSEATYGATAAHWRDINTDAMTLEIRRTAPPHHNVPSMAGTVVPAEAHVKAVTDGFTELWRTLAAYRGDLSRAAGPLQSFRRHRRRVVLRDTGLYATLIDRSLHPRLMRDGTDWSIEREILRSSATAQPSKPRAWSTWVDEERSLSRLDVPLFDAAIDGTALGRAGTESIGGYLVESGYDAAMARLNALHDERRAEAHRQCIRLALRARACPEGDRTASSQDASLADAALRAAFSIGQTLRATAYEPQAPEVAWIGISRAADSTERRIDMVGWDLYGGRCGIALLLATLETRESARTGPSFARRVLAPLEASLNAGGHVDGADPPAVLGAAGLGGIVYALTRVSQLHQSGPMLDAALRAADAITPALIERDRALDVLSGCAGAALGLLTLHAVTGKAWVRDRALRCGTRLLEARERSTEGGGLVWNTPARTANGFAHGAAGIVYALSRLYRETGDRTYRDVVLESRFRDSAYDEHTGATRDDTSRGRAIRLSWCRGIAGVGLARLRIATLLDAPELLEDVDAMLDEVADAPPDRSTSDQVCCGLTGRIEFLVTASTVLERPDLALRARDVAAQMIDRAAQRGTYSITAVDDLFSPGYYQGLAGIAYGLLRSCTPALPSVLLWDGS